MRTRGWQSGHEIGGCGPGSGIAGLVLLQRRTASVARIDRPFDLAVIAAKPAEATAPSRCCSPIPAVLPRSVPAVSGPPGGPFDRRRLRLRLHLSQAPKTQHIVVCLTKRPPYIGSTLMFCPYERGRRWAGWGQPVDAVWTDPGPPTRGLRRPTTLRLRLPDVDTYSYVRSIVEHVSSCRPSCGVAPEGAEVARSSWRHIRGSGCRRISPNTPGGSATRRLTGLRPWRHIRGSGRRRISPTRLGGVLRGMSIHLPSPERHGRA